MSLSIKSVFKNSQFSPNNNYYTVCLVLLNFNCVPFSDSVFYLTIPDFKFIMARNMRALASPSLWDSSYFYQALTIENTKKWASMSRRLPYPFLQHAVHLFNIFLRTSMYTGYTITPRGLCSFTPFSKD